MVNLTDLRFSLLDFCAFQQCQVSKTTVMARKWSKRRSDTAEPGHGFDKEVGVLESSDDDLKSQSTASVTSSGWLCFGRWRARRARHAQPGNMKKFGFGKKSEGDDDDRNRAGLFGRKKLAPQEENPYAQQPAEDPYARMTPYQQARANLAAGPQAPRPGAAGLPSGPRPGAGGLPSGPAQRNGYGTPPPSYQGSPQVGGGYAPDKFGAAGGYGASRYDAGASGYGGAGATPASQTSARFASRGPGGYGGLGPAEEDANRDELLAGARQRHAAPPSYMSTDNSTSDASGATGGYGGGYGEQRELTAEELEKEEFNSIKNQIKDVRKQTVNSSGNAAMQMENSINVGRGILVRLGEQGERLHNTEKMLDLAHNQSRIAEEKTGELKTLNRSMFAVHVSNPFTSTSRQALKDQQVIEQHRLDAEQRDATRKSAYAGTQAMEQTFRDMDRPTLLGQTSRSNAERSKYMIEEDSDEEGAAEDNRDEDEIERNIQAMERNAPTLKYVAQALGAEVDRQDTVITRLGHKTQGVDKNLAVTRAKLNRI
ncbi:hypothetical protein BR93DRAFT_286759 [Coniochaeta sp. PMI_546]|nr:hypothetical protein BR93DRAFT_286759 [Coniochaeta sp. PMI_546]